MHPRATSSLTDDHVVGIFSREGLSTVLAATHRAGFGPQTRVFDGTRGDVRRQLARAGIKIQSHLAPPADALLVVVTAPGRAAIVAELFAQLGSESVQIASGRGSDRATSPATASEQPDIRIGDGSGITSGS